MYIYACKFTVDMYTYYSITVKDATAMHTEIMYI